MAAMVVVIFEEDNRGPVLVHLYSAMYNFSLQTACVRLDKGRWYLILVSLYIHVNAIKKKIQLASHTKHHDSSVP